MAKKMKKRLGHFAKIHISKLSDDERRILEVLKPYYHRGDCGNVDMLAVQQQSGVNINCFDNTLIGMVRKSLITWNLDKLSITAGALDTVGYRVGAGDIPVGGGVGLRQRRLLRILGGTRKQINAPSLFNWMDLTELNGRKAVISLQLRGLVTLDEDYNCDLTEEGKEWLKIDKKVRAKWEK